MHPIGRHMDWLIEGAVFLIAGLLILLFIVAFGLLHVFLYMAYPAILIVAGIALLIMYSAKRK
jgi:predicted membrane protein